MATRAEAKQALDMVIRKSRVHLYKPIQIAEILYRDRVYKDIDLAQLEDYRTKSKRWRDDVCQVLLGRVCTSSAKFQDDLFNETAVPPALIVELGKDGIGAVDSIETDGRIVCISLPHRGNDTSF